MSTIRENLYKEWQKIDTDDEEKEGMLKKSISSALFT